MFVDKQKLEHACSVVFGTSNTSTENRQALEGFISASCDTESSLETHLTCLHQGLFKASFSVDLCVQGDSKFLVFYSPNKRLLLSNLVPVLDHMGFCVETEELFKFSLSASQNLFVHLLQVQIALPVSHFQKSRDRVRRALEAIWSLKEDSDVFNKLVIVSDLEWEECRLIRAYTKYLKQIQFPYSIEYTASVLCAHGDFVRDVVELFHTRFAPLETHPEKEERLKKQHDVEERLQSYLAQVSHYEEERVLGAYLNLILATLRTNFYQKVSKGQSKPYIALKLESARIEDLPRPAPLYEIFVYATFMEGIHLRGGKVARGGIRFSDRLEDYRTEILDLMKTQMIKNAVIVPVGAKGGFIEKTSTQKPTSLQETPVNDPYATFISGLLDLTDNLVNGQAITPEQLIAWDDADPYLVVAADKGTAHRSDQANDIAISRGFWMGDAFASGGRDGYDHKKLGITARGAWVSAEHHFHALGIDLDQTEVSVVGIGDMSGDVFGNGMLLSKKLKLVAAFDHRHIFLDPTPNPSTSYEERRRLFQKDRSSWADYNPEVLSKGGGVFPRHSRLIKLTPEIKARLKVKDNALHPNTLIQHILCAPVDLFWLGGIGTFVKGNNEPQWSAEDKVNNAIRINGSDLQARVVVEGANLGFTQMGRIDFALQGGRINTDAIDNSAGVDCSDHEVNIKILLNSLVNQGRLTPDARNHMLKDMTDDVVHLVLIHNYWQNQAISLASRHNLQLIEEHRRLINTLEESGELDRRLECLPTDQDLQQRKTLGKGLTRPELCVLLSFGKTSLYKRLLDSPFIQDPALEDDFLSYFPSRLKEEFRSECLAHPLRAEITATLLVNRLLNVLGPTFINEVRELTHAPEDLIVKSIWIVRSLLSLDSIEMFRESIQSHHLQQFLFWHVDRVIKRLVIWFLRHVDLTQPFDSIVRDYETDMRKLEQNVLDLIPPTSLAHLREKLIDTKEGKEALDSLKPKLLALEPLMFATDVIQVHKFVKKPLEVVASLYYQLGESLGVRWSREIRESFAAETPWQEKALLEITEQMVFVQQQLTLYILTNLSKGYHTLDDMQKAWAEKGGTDLENYQSMLLRVQQSQLSDMAPLFVLSRELQLLYERIVGTCVMTVSFA
jgi:glutamate dehydrogenase